MPDDPLEELEGRNYPLLAFSVDDSPLSTLRMMEPSPLVPDGSPPALEVLCGDAHFLTPLLPLIGILQVPPPILRLFDVPEEHVFLQPFHHLSFLFSSQCEALFGSRRPFALSSRWDAGWDAGWDTGSSLSARGSLC